MRAIAATAALLLGTAISLPALGQAATTAPTPAPAAPRTKISPALPGSAAGAGISASGTLGTTASTPQAMTQGTLGTGINANRQGATVSAQGALNSTTRSSVDPMSPAMNSAIGNSPAGPNVTGTATSSLTGGH